jgi:hypothetical protein
MDDKMKYLITISIIINLTFSQSGNPKANNLNASLGDSIDYKKYTHLDYDDDLKTFVMKNLSKLSKEDFPKKNIFESEFDKMLEKYNSSIDFKNYWKEKYSVKVRDGQNQIDEATYNYYRDYYKKNMGLEWAVREAKRLATYTPTKHLEKERNRQIFIGDTLSTIDTEWSQIVNVVGGYSEIANQGITKEDIFKYSVNIIFEKIELINGLECLAHIKIVSNEDGLKANNISKNLYRYKGSYKINYDNSYFALYGDNTISIDFIFEEKKYLPSSHTKINLPLPKFLLPKNDNYKNTINMMFDDLTADLNIIKVKSHNDFPMAFKKYHDNGLHKIDKFDFIISIVDTFSDLSEFIDNSIKSKEAEQKKKKKKKKKKWW